MTREEILDTCKHIVTKERQSHYGTPENNFARIARYWSDYLEVVNLEAKDVAMMMILLKIARGQHNSNNPDTWIDIAGYSACGGEIATK